MLWENRFFFKEFNFLLKKPKRVFLEIFYLKASIVWRVPETVGSSQHGFSFQDSRVNKLIQHICRLISCQQSLITEGLLIWVLLILLNSKGWNTNVVLDSSTVIARKPGQDKVSVDHAYSDFMKKSSSSFSRVSEFVFSDAAVLFSSKQIMLEVRRRMGLGGQKKDLGTDAEWWQPTAKDLFSDFSSSDFLKALEELWEDKLFEPRKEFNEPLQMFSSWSFWLSWRSLSMMYWSETCLPSKLLLLSCHSLPRTFKWLVFMKTK